MLAASKELFVADVRQQAMELRKLELDQMVSRYTAMLSIASIVSGFAFAGLVEFELPERDMDNIDTLTRNMLAMFYIAGTVALLGGMYVTVISTYLIASGYRLAMQGSSSRSLDRAVAVLMINFPRVMSVGGVALLALLVAAMSIVWLKTQHIIYSIAIVGTCLTVTVIVLIGLHVARLAYSLSINIVVHGDAVVAVTREDGTTANVDLEVLAPMNRASTDDDGTGVELDPEASVGAN